MFNHSIKWRIATGQCARKLSGDIVWTETERNNVSVARLARQLHPYWHQATCVRLELL
ncbi:hypothetical protein NSU_0658 [Novosphingobium pentaromativorans US6-1]|uniref:Uncharacterized protein n=1 Tax=Novosphingobium pentaromativorans US6-1 TaxID=1088721 RepID=G6E8I7_9SPHN|nr:hypothetical protein NSU_0658 [Novosphingobium pentaromativorans US6-1]